MQACRPSDSHDAMTSASSLTWPQKIFSVLPLTLFLPIGFVYTVAIVVLIALAVSGDYAEKWRSIKAHPFTRPVLVYCAVMAVVALYSDWSRDEFWSHFGHYMTYLSLLAFLALGGGKWKQRALEVFYLSALLGATIFYGTVFGLVPSIKIFESFVVYQGGKSILLGMLLAAAVGWMLLDLVRRFTWQRLAAVLYVSGALLFVAKGRIGYILFIVAILMVAPKLVHLSRRMSLALAFCFGAALVMAWNFSAPLRERTIETFEGVQNYSETQIKDTSTGLRMQMLVGTSIMAAEKPFFGHGMAAWVPEFHARYGQVMGEYELTPHNEYLLHAFEAGLLGLGALLWLWWRQWRTGTGIGGADGERVVMLTAMMLVAALFNVILRDGTYAMAFMVLLAIPFAGARSAAATAPSATLHPDVSRSA